MTSIFTVKLSSDGRNSLRLLFKEWKNYVDQYTKLWDILHGKKSPLSFSIVISIYQIWLLVLENACCSNINTCYKSLAL